MRFLLAVLAALLLAPGSLTPEKALAYATPEDVLLEQLQYYESQNYLPPNSRRVQELNELQEAARAAQHPGTFMDMGNEDAPQPSSSSSSSSAATHEAAGDATDAEGTEAEVPLDDATVRLLQRLERESLHANATAQQQSNPLAPTGLGTLAAIGIAMAGIGMTLWKAKKS
ncbi:MAG: hypothetical protein WCV62_04660 [Candidatus Peribacteraceae bacterium]